MQVLDGQEISSEEASAATERYAGVLTEELLLEQLGLPPYTSLEVLDLSGQSLRDIFLDMRSLDFPALHHLDLSKNLLQTVGSSAPLCCQMLPSKT